MEDEAGQGCWGDPGTRQVLQGFTVVWIGMLYEVYASSHLPIIQGGNMVEWKEISQPLKSDTQFKYLVSTTYYLSGPSLLWDSVSSSVKRGQ